MSRREATVAVPVLRVPLGMQMGGGRLGAAANHVPKDLHYLDPDQTRQRIAHAMHAIIHLMNRRCNVHPYYFQEKDFEDELNELQKLYARLIASYKATTAAATQAKRPGPG